uniref:Uncharacterized protein n=1 Tax=Rhizophora mucronata TaxID=61149 RepID=A0A2P2K234_RHIMU
MIMCTGTTTFSPHTIKPLNHINSQSFSSWPGNNGAQCGVHTQSLAVPCSSWQQACQGWNTLVSHFFLRSSHFFWIHVLHQFGHQEHHNQHKSHHESHWTFHNIHYGEGFPNLIILFLTQWL